jgi:nucleotide-binding universal stress UspA family protein
MSSSVPSPIVVGTDFSEASERALRFAVDLGHALNAPLCLVHAYDAPRLTNGLDNDVQKSFVTWLAKSSLERLQDIVKQHQSTGLIIKGEMHPGDPAGELCRVAANYHAQLIVVGAKGHGASYHALIGSVADRVIRKAQTPVVCVP